MKLSRLEVEPLCVGKLWSEFDVTLFIFNCLPLLKLCCRP